MNDFVYVFDAWRKWSCGVVCVWSRTNSDTIVSMFIWFCYLKWMICGGKLISTSVENLSSWRNSFGPGPHFCQQNKHIPLEKMITWTTCKAVNCFSTVVCVNYYFRKEMGQEYSTKVQIIMKADRGKAIAWRSVSCRMTCYHIPDEKTLRHHHAFSL